MNEAYEPTADVPKDAKGWREHIERYPHSGLSLAEYSRRNQLKYGQFLYWYRKYNQLKKSTLLPVKIKANLSSELLCSFNVGGHELKIHALSALDRILDRII